VLEHSQADMVVSVEAGITLEALQDELGKAGQFLPLDPFNSPGHTIGGLLATGWTGPLRQRFGSARDYLIGIRVAMPDGHLASAGGRVVKNVSGYDLMKLHYGAMGSLGVIVAASFKVFPKPLHDVTLETPSGSIGEAWTAAEKALSMPLAPTALELFSAAPTRSNAWWPRWDGNKQTRPYGRSIPEPRWSPGPESRSRATRSKKSSTRCRSRLDGGPRLASASLTGPSTARTMWSESATWQRKHMARSC
jgi:hypothetical protein